jgi:hypothetical protein
MSTTSGKTKERQTFDAAVGNAVMAEQPSRVRGQSLPTQMDPRLGNFTLYLQEGVSTVALAGARDPSLVACRIDFAPVSP